MGKIIMIAIVIIVLVVAGASFACADEFSRGVQDVRNIFTGLWEQNSQNLCANNRGTGNATEMSHCYGLVIDPRTGRYEGRNNLSVRSQMERGGRPMGDNHYYGAGYVVQPQRGNRLQRAGDFIFGRETYYPYGTRPYGYGYSYRDPEEYRLRAQADFEKKSSKAKAEFIKKAAEAQAKCVEKSTDAYRKAKVVIDAQLAATIQGTCAGTVAPPQNPSESPASEAQYAPEAPPESATPVQERAVEQAPIRKYRGAFRKNGFICNDDPRPLKVFVNGVKVGSVKSGFEARISTFETVAKRMGIKPGPLSWIH